MRIMAVDFGDARTGIAVSDPTGMIAGRAWTIYGRSESKVALQIADAVKETGTERIVVGHPLNMNGTPGERAEKCRCFAEMLRDLTGLDVVMWDERRTTVDAYRVLHENGRNQKNSRGKVDAVAATLILEGYLGCIR